MPLIRPAVVMFFGAGTNWWHDYDYAIGFIAGMGAHPLDMLVWGYDLHLAGKWEVEGTGHIPDGGRNNVVMRWDVRIQCENGVPMSYRAGGTDTAFIGTEDSLRIAMGGQIAGEPPSLVKEVLKPGAYVRKDVDGNHAGHFREAVRRRRDPASNIEDAVHGDIISHVADIAIRSGRKIVWDPRIEDMVGDEQASRRLARAYRPPWSQI